jgi:hypothetical protein
VDLQHLQQSYHLQYLQQQKILADWGACSIFFSLRAGRATLAESGLVTPRNTDANPDTGFVTALGTAETRHDRVKPATQVP